MLTTLNQLLPALHEISLMCLIITRRELLSNDKKRGSNFEEELNGIEKKKKQKQKQAVKRESERVSE